MMYIDSINKEIKETKKMFNNFVYDYDFKKLYLKDYSAESIFSNWLNYRNLSSSVDCDASLLATLVFSELWNFSGDINYQRNKKGSKYEIVTEKYNLRGDSMTSLFTTFKRYVQLTHPDILENGSVPNYRNLKGSNNGKWLQFFSAKKNIIKISDEMKRFMVLYNSIGNMIPVPIVSGNSKSSFNTSRSNYGKFDYVDLMLLAIFNWYSDNNLKLKNLNETDDFALKKLLRSNSDSDALKICKIWLFDFGDWTNFIECNYLQSFVNDNGKPIMLWNNHSFDKPIPDSAQEIEEFLLKVNKMIEERGKYMVKKLK